MGSGSAAQVIMDTNASVSSEATGATTARSNRSTDPPHQEWRSILQFHGRKWIPEGDDRVSIGMYIRSPPKGPFVSAGSRDEIEIDFARVEPDRPGASADALPRVPLANYTPWRPGSKP